MRAYASLRRPGEFSRLRQRGRRVATDALTLYRSDARPSDPRSVVGITVNKAVGTAVVRNLVRRRIGAIAHELLRAQPPKRLLIVARPTAAAATYAELRNQLRGALQ